MLQPTLFVLYVASCSQTSVGYGTDTYLHSLVVLLLHLKCSQTMQMLAIAQTLTASFVVLCCILAVKQCWLQHRHLSASLVVLCCILQSNCVGYSIDTYLHRLQSYVASMQSNSVGYSIDTYLHRLQSYVAQLFDSQHKTVLAIAQTLADLHRLQSSDAEKYVASCSQKCLVLAIAQTLLCNIRLACSLMLHQMQSANSVGYSIGTSLHRLQSYVASCSQTVSGYSIDTSLHRLQSYVASCSQTVLAIAQTLICIDCSLMLHPAVQTVLAIAQTLQTASMLSYDYILRCRDSVGHMLQPTLLHCRMQS